MSVFHYTNRKGLNGIRSQADWLFRASKPPSEHPYGAYFTNLDPSTPKLHKKLLVPREKRDFVFQFRGVEGLTPAPGVGDRDVWILFSPDDYGVARERQQYSGPTDDWGAEA